MDDLTLVIPAKYEKVFTNCYGGAEKYNIKTTIVLEKLIKIQLNHKKFNCRVLFQKNKGYGDALIEGISL